MLQAFSLVVDVENTGITFMHVKVTRPHLLDGFVKDRIEGGVLLNCKKVIRRQMHKVCTYKNR